MFLHSDKSNWINNLPLTIKRLPMIVLENQHRRGQLNNLHFTLCFLKHKNNILLLYRVNPPNKGLWNGVGGHIEAGETPLRACLREVHEETGIRLRSAEYKGILTWQGFEIDDGGLALFTADVDSSIALTPCDEGKLAWKPRKFLYASTEVVPNLRFCAPHFMYTTNPFDYHFIYKDGNISSFSIRRLPNNHLLP